MRRLTKKITSIVLLASFTASLSSMALAADVGTVTDDCVRLRREATTSSDSLGMLVKGDKVSILDQEDNGWLKITYTDSEGTHTGYVSGEFVKTNSTKKTDSKKNTSKDTKKATKAKADTTALRPRRPPRRSRSSRLRRTRPLSPWVPAPSPTAARSSSPSTCAPPPPPMLT